MQTSLSKDSKSCLERANLPKKPSLWSQSGPILLLVAFAILIFKYAHSFWPFLLTAFAGYAANFLWKKRGFYFSLLGLATVSIFSIQWEVDLLWSSLLATSIALSWLLIFLGRQESEAFVLSREEKIKVLEENARVLEEQFCDAFEQVQRQYSLLKEQFDEKSVALDETCRELFRIEHELLVQQKACEEKALEVPEEDLVLLKDLQIVEEEYRDLEIQVVHLQDFISALLSPKKRILRSRKALEDQLPLLIQEKIDLMGSVHEGSQSKGS
jgi:hypothetical protein